MKPATIKTIYWILIIIFVLAMLLDAIGGITRQQAGVDVMKHLGYPVYVLTIFGVAKLIGVIALLQTKFDVIKEWAYAGFTINFLGAFCSRAFVGDGIDLLMPPLIMLLFMFVVYFFWKRTKQLAVV